MAEDDETFAPTGGRLAGSFGLAIAAAAVVLPLVLDDSGIEPWGVALGLFVGAISWAALLRPRLAIDHGVLEMRNMFTTVDIPVTAIDEVSVRQVTAVLVDEKRYTCAAVGRSRGAIKRDQPKPPSPGGTHDGSGIGRLSFGPFGLSGSASGGRGSSRHTGPSMSYGYYVEEQIKRRVQEAKRLSGDQEPGPVERRIAWPEVVAAAGTLLAFVVLVLV